MVTVAPFGTWESPLSASDLVDGALGLGYPTLAGARVLWQESRPSEGGRVALVAWEGAEQGVLDLLPAGMSARSTAHEYGGRAWAAGGPGGAVLVTCNFDDQRLWDVTPGRPPRPLVPAPGAPKSVRFACPAISPDGLWVAAVRERHLPGGVVNDLVAVSLAGRASEPGEPEPLAGGHDFYSSPEFSPDGKQLAFVCWDHPDMPWDRTELWRGQFGDGRLSSLTPLAGQAAHESVLQPRWAPDGTLHFVSDRTGWWNLYRLEPHAGVVSVAPMEAEFAGPAWTFGDSDYVFLRDGTLVATWSMAGAARLAAGRDGALGAIDLPYNCFSDLAPAGAAAVVAVAGGPARAFEVVRIGTDGSVQVLRRSRPVSLGEEWTSAGEAFSFPTGGGELAHAVYYPPVNPGFRAPDGQLPPLIVTSHGGPTANASMVFEPRTQYWTSRGFAVVDVDYRGSSGYGRAYRKALEGRWGLADVEDCAAATKWLADNGRADPARVVIRGSSASGLTVLAALARRRAFAAGAVRYPVADLASLAGETHKFESRYVERLVPASEVEARSPLNLAPEIRVPVLFFHGLDDKVVPPNQSRQMAEALRQRGVDAALVQVEGEGHGFRRASTAVRAQEAELAFYGEVLGFEPAGDLARARADLARARLGGGVTWQDEGQAGAA